MRLKPAALVYDHGWQIDVGELRRAITARTRALVIVHPNNPTGHFTKTWEATELAALCREFHLSLIVDEVFLDYGFEGEYSSFASGLEDVPVFVVSGLSKIAGLPQMKAAWIAATGPEREQALDRLEVIADTFLSMNAPVQCALPAWLEDRAKIQRADYRSGKDEPGRAGPAACRVCRLSSACRWRAAGTRCSAFRLCSRTSRRCWRCLSAAYGFIPGISSECRRLAG